jgi:hypothetical protein
MPNLEMEEVVELMMVVEVVEQDQYVLERLLQHYLAT